MRSLCFTILFIFFGSILCSSLNEERYCARDVPDIHSTKLQYILAHTDIPEDQRSNLKVSCPIYMYTLDYEPTMHSFAEAANKRGLILPFVDESGVAVGSYVPGRVKLGADMDTIFKLMEKCAEELDREAEYEFRYFMVYQSLDSLGSEFLWIAPRGEDKTSIFVPVTNDGLLEFGKMYTEKELLNNLISYIDL